MNITGSIVAVFASHHATETAIKRLVASGIALTQLSVIGKGSHSEERVVRFSGTGKRGEFADVRGMFWGKLSAMFVGGNFLTTPGIGHVVILGYLASDEVASPENVAIGQGLSEVGDALYALGMPRESVLDYEAVLREDGFLVMVHGNAAMMIGAKLLLGKLTPVCLDMHVTERRSREPGRQIHIH